MPLSLPRDPRSARGGPVSLLRRILLGNNRLDLPFIGIELRLVPRPHANPNGGPPARRARAADQAGPTSAGSDEAVASASADGISMAISFSSAAVQREQVAHSVLNRAAKEA